MKERDRGREREREMQELQGGGSKELITEFGII